MLALSQVQERHDGRLLVLRRVSFKDLINESEVLGREFEGNIRIVVACVSVLYAIDHLASEDSSYPIS
jgi:hypothetical protein